MGCNRRSRAKPATPAASADSQLTQVLLRCSRSYQVLVLTGVHSSTVSVAGQPQVRMPRLTGIPGITPTHSVGRSAQYEQLDEESPAQSRRPQVEVGNTQRLAPSTQYHELPTPGSEARNDAVREIALREHPSSTTASHANDDSERSTLLEAAPQVDEGSEELEAAKLALAKALHKTQEERAQEVLSPLWFESRTLVHFFAPGGCMYKSSMFILALAPFVQLGGFAMETVLGCSGHADQSPARTVRAVFAFGMFSFCAAWPAWYHYLAMVVHCSEDAAHQAGSGALRNLRRERKPNDRHNQLATRECHKMLTKEEIVTLRRLLVGLCTLSWIMLAGIMYIIAIFLGVELFDVDRDAGAADAVLDLFVPVSGCITTKTEDIYIWLLVTVWGTAALLTSFAMPAWLLSLQLASTLAADSVYDVMQSVGRLVHCDSRESSGSLQQHPLDPQILTQSGWDQKVQIPVAMLIQTMRHLSQWGRPMACTVGACWTFVLCSVPTVVATKNGVLLCAMVVLFLVPFLVVWAPARVSSSCDDMLNQLNELSLLGDEVHKQRVESLLNSMRGLNRGQGLGFQMLGTVVDKRMLVKFAVALSAGTGLLTKMVAMGAELESVESFLNASRTDAR